MIVLTGAAGYIGAHVCKLLLDLGQQVVAIDNFSTGHREFIDSRADFFEGSVQDANFISSIFEKYKTRGVQGVIHISGLKFAGESVINPLTFYENNASSTQVLLSAMKEFGVSNLVFSSSCSVYGDNINKLPVSESSALKPVSPYGRSKLFSELMIRDAYAIGLVKPISLRYFNVAGGTPGVSADFSRYNLLPNLYRSITMNREFNLFGDTYETPDGTCVRDYLDVQLLAEAHITALQQLMKGKVTKLEYNLGSGRGHSVKEIIKAVSRVTNVEPKIKVLASRDGDPAYITADIQSAVHDLKWQHNKTIEEIVQNGWEAWNSFRGLWD